MDGFIPVDWDREKLLREVVSHIRDGVLVKKNIELEPAELKILKSLYRGHPIEEIESKILYLAWGIPSGALPVAAEAVINLLIEEAFEKSAE